MGNARDRFDREVFSFLGALFYFTGLPTRDRVEVPARRVF
jgi:hypothetical protein